MREEVGILLDEIERRKRERAEAEGYNRSKKSAERWEGERALLLFLMERWGLIPAGGVVGSQFEKVDEVLRVVIPDLGVLGIHGAVEINGPKIGTMDMPLWASRSTLIEELSRRI